MLASWFTNAGPAREGNQDAVLVGGCVYASLASPVSSEIREGGLIAVADGVGGYPGGDMAARILLTRLAGYSSPPGDGTAESEVRRLLAEASADLAAAAARDSLLALMSSAVAGVCLVGDTLTAFNCGDCRVYLLRRPYLSRLTRDHSAVQPLLDAGLIDEDGMRLHPKRHVLTSSIGAGVNPPEVFFKTVPARAPARLFLCSDGVWEALPLETLEEIVCLPPGEAAAGLAGALFQVQASDNVSFIILDI
ncbi:MAG: serine/threonine-protein phosphatase [Deltaproteobacteria bacterium]|jgi:protein phosphatase|nr:serine/threonine-protein phosphatase [Deltaproteobacteria bacterium]